MSTPDPARLGSLDVSVKSESVYFGDNTPVEIRDASMQLVMRGRNMRSLQLPEGLYQVSAVLEDGQEQTCLVKVRGGESTSVKLGGRPAGTSGAAAGAARLAAAVPAAVEGVVDRIRAAVSDAADTATARMVDAQSRAHRVAQSTAAQLRNSRFTQKADAPDDESSSTDGAAATAATLLDVKGAKLRRQTRTLWIFECTGSLTAVAVATLQVGDRRTEISLPTSPPMGGPNLCAVRIDETPGGARATAWISPERTVANALQNMFASGHLSSAASMADEATELLRGKYEDPTGATLAALILRKVGRLARLEGWMDNLARDFAWIPDGKVMLAALLLDRRADPDRALSLVLEAAKQRMLYTESYSILLDLLRRWPREADRSARAGALAGLAAHSPYIDWNSSCLSRVLEN
jgi:hypothetical protein